MNISKLIKSDLNEELDINELFGEDANDLLLSERLQSISNKASIRAAELDSKLHENKNSVVVDDYFYEPVNDNWAGPGRYTIFTYPDYDTDEEVEAYATEYIETPKEFDRIIYNFINSNIYPTFAYIEKQGPVYEDTEKKRNGKWVNKGKEGEHGEFKTKKEADAQRKAMFANGYHESLDESFSSSAARNVTVDLANYIQDNGYYNYDTIDIEDGPLNTVIATFEIEGDWKHDHFYFESLCHDWADMTKDKAIFKIDCEITSDDGDDWYTANHIVYICNAEDLEKLKSMQAALNNYEESDYKDTDFNFDDANLSKIYLDESATNIHEFASKLGGEVFAKNPRTGNFVVVFSDGSFRAFDKTLKEVKLSWEEVNELINFVKRDIDKMGLWPNYDAKEMLELLKNYFNSNEFNYDNLEPVELEENFMFDLKDVDCADKYAYSINGKLKKFNYNTGEFVISFNDGSFSKYDSNYNEIALTEQELDDIIKAAEELSINPYAKSNQVAFAEKQLEWAYEKKNNIINENIKTNELSESFETFNYDKYIKDIIDFIENEGLNLSPRPQVIINNDEQEGILIDTGKYFPEENKITLFVNGRHPKDVLRSLCHELIHHSQNLESNLNNIQSNSISEDESLKDVEAEAYEQGNLYFRKWTESIGGVNNEI